MTTTKKSPAKKPAKKKAASTPTVKPTAAAVAQLEDKIADETRPVIGDLVWWDLRGVLVDRSWFEDELVNASLEGALCPERSSDTYFSRALNRVEKRESVEFKRAKRCLKEIIVRPVSFKATVDESAEIGFKADVESVTTPAIVLDREAGALACQDENDPVFVAVKAEYARQLGTANASDVRITITNIMNDLSAVPLREAGGMYFVPDRGNSRMIIEKIQEIVRQCGESDLYAPRLPAGNSNWSRACESAAVRSMGSDYENIVGEMEAFVQRSIDGELLQERVLLGRIEEAEQLKSKASLYQDVLEIRGEKLTEASDMLKAGTRVFVAASGDVRALRKASKAAGADTDIGKDLRKKADEKLAEAAEKVRELIASAKAKYALPKSENGNGGS